MRVVTRFAAFMAAMLVAQPGGAAGGDLPSPAEAGFAKAGAALMQMIDAAGAPGGEAALTQMIGAAGAPGGEAALTQMIGAPGAPGGDLPSPAEAGFAKAGAALTQMIGAPGAQMIGAPGAPGEEVDLELVLAADVSRSVDDAEFQLQRQGYAAALTDRRVMMAIRAGHIGKIALCIFEWSGEFAQRVIVDWMVVGDEESAAYAADRLLTVPRPFGERTAIGVALEYALALFPRNVHKGARRTIDVSGDGTNTNGVAPSIVRDRAVAAGITINGLVILSPEPMPWNPMHTHPPGGLQQYFEKNVIGGPGAFAMVVEDHKTFVQAMTSKLIKEIAGDVRRQAAKAD